MHVIVDVDQSHLHQGFKVAEGFVSGLGAVVARVQKVSFAFEVEIEVLDEPVDQEHLRDAESVDENVAEILRQKESHTRRLDRNDSITL